VKRLSVGDVVALTNGLGALARGTVSTLEKNLVACHVEHVDMQRSPAPLHVRVPIADRDRMLWLAEKATEIGITTWQAVRFHRSTSVSPRGEGSAFAVKLRLRMIAALEQSGGAWLPVVLPDVEPGAVDAPDASASILLDAAGVPLLRVLDRLADRQPTVLFGPEGGIEAAELAQLEAKGWQRGRLASTTLRFETAGVAAIAVIRAAQLITED
jgi:16S rRNA (uracil1498-N3)-methyltransferase